METMTESVFFSQLKHAHTAWVPRSEAEIVPSYKQLIPYMVPRAGQGRWIGCYRRKGSESRLHDLWSCGIGGHVNPVDAKGCRGDLKEILDSGLSRELDEELPRRPVGCRPVFRGVINEEQTEVGTVHFGLVYTLDISEPAPLVPGEELSGLTWVPIERVRSLNLELWSTLALDLIGKPNGDTP